MDNKHKYIKRFLAFILSAAMVLTYMPMSMLAYAEGEDGQPVAAEEQPASNVSEVSQSAAPKAAAEPAPEAEALPIDDSISAEPAKGSSPSDETANDGISAEATESQDAKPSSGGELPNPGNDVDETERGDTPDESNQDTMDAVTLRGNAGGVSVVVKAPEGALYSGTTLSVKAVDSEEVIDSVSEAVDGEIGAIKAVDISFIKDGKEYEPLKPVTVYLNASGMDNEAEKSVVHIDDAGIAKAVEDVQVSGTGTAKFETDEFSIYVIVDSGTTETFRRTYKFLNEIGADGSASAYTFVNKAGQTVDNQIIKDGDALEDVGIPYLSGKTFIGWYLAEESGSGYAYTDTEVDFETAISGITEDETVYVAPKYEAVYYVTFHETAEGSEEDIIQTKKVVYTSGSDANKVLISDVIAPQPDSLHVFLGWKDGDTEYKIYDDNNSQIVTTYIENITSDMDIYPFFEEAYWLRFVSGETGSRASYVPARFVLKDQTITSLPVPTRSGYHFDGWYTGSQDDQGKITYEYQVTDGSGAVAVSGGLSIEEETTLYGRWTANTDSTYTVVIWKQKVTDNKNAADEDKTYDYEESEVRNGTTDDPVGPSDGDISHEYTGFHYARTVQTSATVRADGSTVINVYYDRDLMAINFYYTNADAPDDAGTAYQYTATDSDSGTQYGLLEDGTYIQLTRDSGTTETIVYYTYGNGNNQRTYTGTFYTRSGGGGCGGGYVYNPTQYNGNNLPPENDGVTYYTQNGDRLTRRTRPETTYHWTYTVGGTTYPYTGTRYTRSNMTGWKMVTLTGLYGQTFEQAGGSWPNTQRWNEAQNGGGMTQTLLSGFTQTERPYNLYDQGASGNNNIYHHIQTLNGNYSEADEYTFIAKTATDSTNFNFSNKFDGFKVSSYSTSSEGFRSNGGTHAVTDGQRVDNLSIPLHVYHTRQKFSITYYSEGAEVATTGEDSIFYGAPLDDYDYTLEQAGLDERDHYEFTGWYADEACTHHFDFSSTMPAANVAVYAGWEPMWYQILVDPAGGVITPDIGSTYFWKQYEDTFDAYTVSRTYIEDPDGTYKYVYVDGRDDPDGNIQVRTATYVPAEAGYTGTRYRPMTSADPEYHFVGWYVVDSSGNTTSTPYDFNSLIEGPVAIRAVWTLEGKYQVQYIPTAEVDDVQVSGTFTQSDADAYYADGAETVVPGGPTDVTQGYVFEGWEVVDDDGAVLDNNGGSYYQPGGDLILNAAAWANSNKVIKVRAHYAKVETSEVTVEMTTLKFDANGGTLTEAPTITDKNNFTNEPSVSGNVATYTHLPINQDYALSQINDKVTRTGYELAGWNTSKSAADAGAVEFDLDATIGVDELGDKTNTLYAVYKLKLQIEITGNTDTLAYNGNEQSVSGYTIKFKVGNDEWTTTAPDGVTISLASGKTAEAKGTNAGTYNMELTRTDFEIDSGNYAFDSSEDLSYTDGWLEITKKAVTVTADDQTKIYDNDPSTDPALTYTITDTLTEAVTVIKDSIQISISRREGQDVDTYVITVTGPGETANYTLTYVDGEFEITKKAVTITINGNSDTKVYNGEAQTSGTTVTPSCSDSLFDASKFSYTGATTITKTDVGEYTEAIDTTKASYDDDNLDVTFVAGTPVTFKITKATMTLDVENYSGAYDGTAHSVTASPSVTVGTTLYYSTKDPSAEDFDAERDWSPDAPTWTDFTNGAKTVYVKAENPNYETVTSSGTVTVTKKKITLEGSDSVVYNGNEQKLELDASAATGVVSGETLGFDRKPTAKGTDAGTYGGTWKKDDTSSYDFNFGSWYVTKANNDDSTDNYELEITGTLTITKKPITITINGNSDTKVYNGEEQTSETEVTPSCSDSLFDASKFSYTGATTITKTNAGSYTEAIDITKAAYSDANFDVTFAAGTPVTFEITKKAVTVTITGNTNTGTYNGSEQKVEGYTTSISDPLYKESDFAFNGTAEAGGTNAGTYTMGLKASQFTNNNDNFDVTFNVTDGSIVIGRKAVTVTANDSSKTEGGADPALTATVTGLVGDDTISYDISRSGGETPGTYVISVTGDEIQGNYEVTFVNGTFTIDEAPAPDDDPTPVPGGGGGNPGGGGPAVTPAGPVTPAVVPDEPVPQVEPADIPDDPTPAAPPQNPWALINLICAALATVGAAVALFRKKEEDDEDSDPDDENDNRGRNMAIAKVLGVLAAAASIITFILTEDMSGPMQLTDKWTILMAVLFAAQIGTAIANKKASELDEEEEEEGAEA